MLLQFAGKSVGEVSDPFEHQGTWFATFRALENIENDDVAPFIHFCQDWTKRIAEGKADPAEFERCSALLAPGLWSLAEDSGLITKIGTPTFLDGTSGEVSWVPDTTISTSLEHVYVLQHVRYDKEGDPWSEENVKMIGVYRSADAAKNSIARLIRMPGFRDHPDLIDPLTSDYASGFYLDRHELDHDSWSEGFGFD